MSVKGLKETVDLSLAELEMGQVLDKDDKCPDVKGTVANQGLKFLMKLSKD
jgi:hypothetical protein